MTYTEDQPTIKSGANIDQAVKEYCEAWGMSDEAANTLMEGYQDLLPDLFADEDINPFEDEDIAEV